MAAGRNEAAVELEVLYPLLTQPGQLAIPADAVKPKQYLPPTQLDKVGGRTSGYFPDFSVWLVGYPVAVVEAKDPELPLRRGSVKHVFMHVILIRDIRAALTPPVSH